MFIIECKKCGAPIEAQEGKTTCKCEYCQSINTIAKIVDNAEAYNRADYLRRTNEFDKAMNAYEILIQNNAQDYEAYWGYALSEYGIEYVEDPATGERKPTCHRLQENLFTESVEYKNALENAPSEVRRVYETEGTEIARIQREIWKLSKEQESFDIFICYKETDSFRDRTQDSVMAYDLYKALTAEGYKVFFSRVTLEDKLGTAYEPYIFSALQSSKVMIAMGTKPEYFNAVWVKNEWSRYLSLIKKGAKKTLIPAYKDMAPEDMPKEFAHLQGQDLSKVGAIQDLVRGISKIIVADSTKESKAKAEAEIKGLLDVAFEALEQGEWKNADDSFKMVQNIDARNAKAYLGALLAELHVKKEEQLKDVALPFDNKLNYKMALQYSDQETADRLKGYAESVKARYKKTTKTTKTVSIIAGSVACVVALVVLLIEVIIPAARYQHALNLMDKQHNYIKAGEILEDLGDYKESAANLEICKEGMKYNEAIALMEAGEYDQALEVLKTIKNSYRFSENEMMQKIVDLRNKAIAEANEVLYNAAMELYNAGKWEEAAAAFGSLDYLDSKQKAIDIIAQAQIANLTNVTVGSTIKLGTYEQDNDRSNGQEEIEWIVLAIKDNKALVISKFALDKQPYSNNLATSWGKCSLRTWLNEDFYDKAFGSPWYEDNIAETEVLYFDGKAHSEDKVFLLSPSEADMYFQNNDGRQCTGTSYVLSYENLVKSINGNCCWWLLPEDTSANVPFVNSVGSIDFKGVRTAGFAVRPALWINLEP